MGLAAFVVSQSAGFAAQGKQDVLGGLTLAQLVILLLHYGQVIPVLLGAWVIGQDFAPGPRRVAFLVTPRRGTLLTTKLFTSAMLGFLAALVCGLAVLIPPLLGGATDGTQPSQMGPYSWLVAYWVIIAVVTSSLVAATRSITFAVVPLLVWTLGLSGVLGAHIPALSAALDQVFAAAYLQGGLAPPATDLFSAGVQVVVVVALGAISYRWRDVQ